jgi:hypothetical protein
MPVSRQSLKDLWRSAANPAWLCFAWFGMTAGISLLEAPVKFTAPTITREIALDVGRVVFAALNQAELIALILLLILTRISGRAKHLWIGIGPLALIVLAQSVWLLPELSERSKLIVAGLDPGPSMAHATYAVLELLKLLLLLFLGFRAMPKAATA